MTHRDAHTVAHDDGVPDLGCWATVAFRDCRRPVVSDVGLCAGHLEELRAEPAPRTSPAGWGEQARQLHAHLVELAPDNFMALALLHRLEAAEDPDAEAAAIIAAIATEMRALSAAARSIVDGMRTFAETFANSVARVGATRAEIDELRAQADRLDLPAAGTRISHLVVDHSSILRDQAHAFGQRLNDRLAERRIQEDRR